MEHEAATFSFTREKLESKVISWLQTESDDKPGKLTQL